MTKLAKYAYDSISNFLSLYDDSGRMNIWQERLKEWKIKKSLFAQR